MIVGDQERPRPGRNDIVRSPYQRVLDRGNMLRQLSILEDLDSIQWLSIPRKMIDYEDQQRIVDSEYIDAMRTKGPLIVGIKPGRGECDWIYRMQRALVFRSAQVKLQHRRKPSRSDSKIVLSVSVVALCRTHLTSREKQPSLWIMVEILASDSVIDEHQLTMNVLDMPPP